MTEGATKSDNLSIKLAEGLLTLYEPDLKRVKLQLDELRKKQTTLLDELHEENLRFASIQSSDELQQMFALTKLYQSKLIGIKKEMLLLHDRTTKLKKRALKLQQAKQKIALQREVQLQREADLIAKPQPQPHAM